MRSKIGSGRFDPAQFNGSISQVSSQQFDDASSIKGVKVYMMKHDKVEGGIKIESEESENEMLDKYQPSDGFSDPINQFTEINEEETDDNMNANLQNNDMHNNLQQS